MLLIAHLDLKGVHRRPEYYEDYLDSLQLFGYRALLVEYEDRFPFADRDFGSAPEEIWTPEFVASFQESAFRRGIEIIPLQQCLSHLEYAFRRPEYQQYSLCPKSLRDVAIDQPEARRWILEQLEQIILAHPRSRYVHIGMDEAVALNDYAAARGRHVLTLFLEYLDELCSLCEQHGKTPLIWSDMLEDHIAPEVIERLRTFRDRLILVPWDYFTRPDQPPVAVRLAGFRCSRRWLDTPQDAPEAAAPFQRNLETLEDLPQELRELTDDLYASPWALEPLFQVAVWKKLGFRVIGGAGASMTQDRSLLPYYGRRFANIEAWRVAAKKHQLEGILMTQWARSNSNSVPNLIPDVTWPILASAAESTSFAKQLALYYPGIPEEALGRLIPLIGNCREGWNIEAKLLDEMKSFTPQEHAYEWRTMSIMLDLLRLQKDFEAIIEDISCYIGIGRLSAGGWRTRLEQLEAVEREIVEKRPGVRAHLAERYFESALEEWCYKVFGAPLEMIRQTKKRVIPLCLTSDGH